MNKFAALAAFVAVAAASSSAFAIEPIQGSINYGGHQSYLEKAPAGSSFDHAFITSRGDQATETYVVNADRSVSLVSRAISETN